MNPLVIALIGLWPGSLALPVPVAQQAKAPRPWSVDGYVKALEASQKEPRPIVLLIRASWSTWCQRLDDETLSDPGVIRDLAPFRCVRVDADSAEGKDLVAKIGVRTFPSIYLVRPNGQPDDLISGFIPAPDLRSELGRWKAGRDTRTDLAAKVRRSPKDIALRFRLALKLDILGDVAGYDAELQEIARLDPEGRSHPIRQKRLQRIEERLFGCQQNGEPVDPEELESFLKDETHPDLRYDGYAYLAGVYRQLERPTSSVTAGRRAWSDVQPTDSISFGTVLSDDLWNARDELTSSDRKFAMKVARRVSSARRDQAPTSPEDLAASHDLMARAHVLNRATGKARKEWQAALKLCPDDPTYLGRLRDL